MSKERLNGRNIRLKPGDVFVSFNYCAFTALGSILEGIKSIKNDLPVLSENGMTDNKRQEWEEEIDNRSRKVGEIIGREMPRGDSLREELIEQQDAIVKKRRGLSRLADLS